MNWDDLGQSSDPNRSTLPVLWRAPSSEVKPHRKRARRITPQEEDRIIELKLRNYSVREIRQMTGHAKDTICSVWNSYLTGLVEDRHGELELHRESALAGYERVMREAWAAWEESKRQWVQVGGVDTQVDSPGDPRMLAEYQRALAQVVKLTGVEHAAKLEVEVSGRVDVQVDVGSMSDAQLRDLLAGAV